MMHVSCPSTFLNANMNVPLDTYRCSQHMERCDCTFLVVGVRTSVRNCSGLRVLPKRKEKKRDAMCDSLRRRESIEARNSDARCNDNDYDDSDDDNELLSIGINSSVKG